LHASTAEDFFEHVSFSFLFTRCFQAINNQAKPLVEIPFVKNYPDGVRWGGRAGEFMVARARELTTLSRGKKKCVRAGVGDASPRV
jgi:hypothetical protein